MKIEATASPPNNLLLAINKAIKSGDLKTWKIVIDADDNILYTHTPPQWNEEALIEPKVLQNKVVFEITFWKGKPKPSKETAGYYLGRFTEILLVHFRNYFTKLETYA